MVKIFVPQNRNSQKCVIPCEESNHLRPSARITNTRTARLYRLCTFDMTCEFNRRKHLLFWAETCKTAILDSNQYHFKKVREGLNLDLFFEVAFSMIRKSCKKPFWTKYREFSPHHNADIIHPIGSRGVPIDRARPVTLTQCFGQNRNSYLRMRLAFKAKSFRCPNMKLGPNTYSPNFRPIRL
jgi:hypothetical protein